MADSDGTVAFSEEQESPLKMTSGTAAAGSRQGTWLDFAAVEGMDDARGNDTVLLPFIGVLRMSDQPQDSDWYFLPRYGNLAQAAAIAIFLRGDVNVIWVSSLSGEEGGRKVLESAAI
jgi:hypothetical protein